MIDFGSIVEIVKTDEARQIKDAVVYTVVALAILTPLAVYAFRRFRKAGLFFFVIASAFLYSMATKPSRPRIQWDDYITDNGSEYLTNTVSKIGVTFKWKKTRLDMPDSTPLYIAKTATNAENYVIFATTTVGAHSYSATIAGPESYNYYVFHEWIPPSPVHTNGVWLGNVLEKAKGTVGTDKIVIIRGQLLENGKVIAPCTR